MGTLCITDLVRFTFDEDYHSDKEHILMGNGASELIDLVVRDGARAGFFCGGDDSTQYKEYGRSTNVAGYVTVPPGDERSTLASIVNGYPETDFAEKRPDTDFGSFQNAQSRSTFKAAWSALQPFEGSVLQWWWDHLRQNH